jgi:hypothetical protein
MVVAAGRVPDFDHRPNEVRISLFLTARQATSLGWTSYLGIRRANALDKPPLRQCRNGQHRCLPASPGKESKVGCLPFRFRILPENTLADPVASRRPTGLRWEKCLGGRDPLSLCLIHAAHHVPCFGTRRRRLDAAAKGRRVALEPPVAPAKTLRFIWLRPGLKSHRFTL